MSDAFLPGNGFDTYETQDKVLVSMDGSVDCGVAVRILQQQGFGVAGAVVQLAADQSAWAAAARQAAEALGIECIVLKAEALADQPAEVLGSGNDARFAALLTAADKLGIQYVATGHHARVELGSDGVHTVCPAVDAALDESAALAALPQADYIDLLAALAAENGSGDEELLLSARDREAVGAAVVDAANAGASAVATAALLHYKKATVPQLKADIRAAGVEVRV